VKEAVKRVQHGHNLSDLIGDTTLTAAADAITLRRLSVLEQTLIAKKVDSQEKDAKPNNITMRIFKIEGFSHGPGGLEHSRSPLGTALSLNLG
jgi:hypothetical protein